MQANIRAVAATDIESAVAYYRNEASSKVAHDFITALESAIAHVRQHPLTGSLRFAFELEIPSLRSWPLGAFPHLIFYLPNDNHIDIWRVLDARRDIPAHLTSDPPD